MYIINSFYYICAYLFVFISVLRVLITIHYIIIIFLIFKLINKPSSSFNLLEFNEVP